MEEGLPISLAEIIVDFCRVPRTRQEIAARASISIDHLKEYLQPLIDSGKLKMTIPAIPTSTSQKFIQAESDTIIFSEQALLEYCKTARSKVEMMDYFDYRTNTGIKDFLGRLVREGKLTYLHPEMPMCRWQKYITVTQ